ncbi:helix-turn-helix transcriptional regulator [Fibrella sp. HMF5335]|uniref:Helix-turn-helix transcriptional regulator n=1 Tax=Fibrella rubiginis TaxID=2817060 RepID=A0A939GEW6_9BACT|nr:AraC family transcriptional regulator [Fibrella rubiginis]MBO0935163.1 helix-turn-helix transcriptional regulator [Fibrella rubiginis]
MTLQLNPFTLFDICCIAQGFTTAAVLFWRSDQPANRWLAWLLVGLTLQIVDYFLSLSGIYYHHQWLYFLPLFYSWSFGPLLYGYMCARAGRPATLPRWYWVPVIIQVLFYGLLMTQSLDTKTWFWKTVHKPYTRYVDYYVACAMVLYAIYQSRRFTTDRWLRRLLNGLALFYGIAAIDPLLNQLYIEPDWPKFYLTTLILPILVYGLALVSILYDRRQKLDRIPTSVVVLPAQRDRLLQAIQAQALYKDPDLTLTTLAQHLGETPNAVSRLINSGFNQSFNEFINSYRIEEVKRRMAAGDTEHLTILALALDAGFASKTTFNRVFKEQTGETPKAYVKKSQITLRDDADA